MHSRPPENVTHRSSLRGPGGRLGLVLLLALGACSRPGPAEPAPAPTQAAPVAAVPAPVAPEAPDASVPHPALDASDASVPPMAPDASAAAPAPSDLELQLAVRKPLSLTASGLIRGALVVTVTNRGQAPVEAVHADVHGLRFIDTKTGTVHLVEHPCDCGFVLGQASYPPSRHLRLAPGASEEILFEEWGCGGGPFIAPPPGRYRVSWRLAAPAVPEQPLDERMRERCLAVLLDEAQWRGAPVSNELELELSSQKTRSRR